MPRSTEREIPGMPNSLANGYMVKVIINKRIAFIEKSKRGFPIALNRAPPVPVTDLRKPERARICKGATIGNHFSPKHSTVNWWARTMSPPVKGSAIIEIMLIVFKYMSLSFFGASFIFE